MLGASRNKRRKRPQQDAEHYFACKADKPGLQERFIDTYKGRGVFTTEAVFRGDIVLEYRGELSSAESLDWTNLYSDSESVFLFDFQWRGKYWCMGASKEDWTLGRLVKETVSIKIVKITTTS